MRVKDICSREVACCSPETNLATAGCMMWEKDCGMLPVVDSEGKAVGVITDRDICMAVATKHRTADQILVREVINGRMYSCRPGDDVRSALELMSAESVRRLPVVDNAGNVEGVLSLSDVALAVRPSEGVRRPGDLTCEDFSSTYQDICRHVPQKMDGVVA